MVSEGIVAAIGGTQLLVKLLGPSFEYLGNELKEWNEKRLNNLKSIFQKTEKIIDFSDEEGKRVSPRVLKEIINEGSVHESDIAQEYFAGILASARTTNERDDRAAIVLKFISQLTTYQIIGHYITYHAVRKVYMGEDYSFTRRMHRDKMRVFIHWNDFSEMLGLNDQENPEILIPHIFFGLRKYELIEDFSYGNEKGVRISPKGKKLSGIIIIPSAIGAELFLSVYNKSDLRTRDILSEKHEFKEIESINLNKEFQKATKVK